MTTYKTIESITTSFERAEALVSQLSARKDAWAELGIPERITYLRRCINGVQSVAVPWMEAACRAKGIAPTENLAGEVWLAGVIPILRNLRQLIDALEADGQPQPIGWHTRSDGQAVAEVFPKDPMDQRIWTGFTGEVWIEPGQPTTQGARYREKSSTGSVALILGSGNNESATSTDILHKLFVEKQVAIAKMSPAKDYEGPFLEEAFAPLIEDGFLSVVYGGAELGNYLCQHPEVDTVHLTGSQHTHDLIMWGTTPEERSQRQAANEPMLSKPLTSRLGCVTPILVVPGPWSKGDLAFQARQVASMVAHNGSFNCDAAQVVVTAKGWKQREAFLTQLHQELAAIPARKAYYPGAQQRYQAFLDRYPQAQPLTRKVDQDSIPWTVIPDVPPEKGEYALTQEALCGVLAEVTLDASDPVEFLSQAVNFANHNVDGTLACILLVHPATEKSCAAELERSLSGLHYGVIGVNVWTGVLYGIGVASWGAFPKYTLANIGSGRGVVRNTYLFDHPQKSVLRAPFRISPTPVWFVNNKNLLQLSKQVMEFEDAPSWGKLGSLGFAALQG